MIDISSSETATGSIVTFETAKTLIRIKYRKSIFMFAVGRWSLCSISYILLSGVCPGNAKTSFSISALILKIIDFQLL